MSDRFDGFSDDFDPHLHSGNHDVSRYARHYLCGLTQSPKGNMERIAEVVPDSDGQVLQNFLTHSSWDHRAMMNQVACNANAWVGGDEGTGLYMENALLQMCARTAIFPRKTPLFMCQSMPMAKVDRYDVCVLTKLPLRLENGWQLNLTASGKQRYYEIVSVVR